MALKVKDYKPSNSDEIFESVYMRVQKIQTANLDYEFYENIPNSNDQKLSWTTRFENWATVFVWIDEVARNNRAQILDHFVLQFDINLDSDKNIYSQVYDYLSDKFGRDNVENV